MRTPGQKGPEPPGDSRATTGKFAQSVDEPAKRGGRSRASEKLLHYLIGIDVISRPSRREPLVQRPVQRRALQVIAISDSDLARVKVDDLTLRQVGGLVENEATILNVRLQWLHRKASVAGAHAPPPHAQLGRCLPRRCLHPSGGPRYSPNAPRGR